MTSQPPVSPPRILQELEEPESWGGIQDLRIGAADYRLAYAEVGVISMVKVSNVAKFGAIDIKATPVGMAEIRREADGTWIGHMGGVTFPAATWRQVVEILDDFWR